MLSISRRSLCVGLLVAVTAVLLPSRADARNVYLNGVKLDSNVSLKPQTFSGCDVRIDEKGDIHITAKGYKVTAQEGRAQVAQPAPAAPSAGPRGFWLVTKQTERGAVQYDVDIFINDAFVKKVRSIDEPTVLDVSRFVRSGQNRVRMVAIKNTGERRASSSPTDTLEIFLGEGTVGGGTVTVDKVHATFTRNASETNNFREDFTFAAP
jgi:hypothetical protein